MNALRSQSLGFLSLFVLIILTLELLMFLPSLAQERLSWLRQHLRDADTALSVSSVSHSIAGAPLSNVLLRLSDVELIRVRRADGTETDLASAGPERFDRRVDLRKETGLQGVERVVMALLQPEQGRLLVIGNSPRQPETVIEVIVPTAHLRTTLLHFAATHAMEWLISACVMGIVLFVALMLLLSRPLRQMAATSKTNAIAGCSTGLVDTQIDARMTVWRNARLAAVGMAFRKVNHDLRGSLSSAMLAADRLSLHADPVVRRSGELVVSAIERSSEMMRQMLDFAQGGPPSLDWGKVCIQEVVAELAKVTPGLKVTNHVVATIVVKADRLALFRVLSNLARNAEQQGATCLTISVEQAQEEIAILVGDDGPGLPPAIQSKLFSASKTPHGTGFGLAIVRDLMLAHGGDALLERTGPAGTVFRLVLPNAGTDAD